MMVVDLDLLGNTKLDSVPLYRLCFLLYSNTNIIA